MRQFMLSQVYRITADSTHAKKGMCVGKGEDGWYLMSDANLARAHADAPVLKADAPVRRARYFRDYWRFLCDFIDVADEKRAAPYHYDLAVKAPRVRIK